MGESSNEGLELCKVLVHTLPPGNYDVYLGPILFCQSLQFIFQVADIVPFYSFINTIKCAVGEQWVFQNKTCQVSSFLERFSPSNWKKKLIITHICLSDVPSITRNVCRGSPNLWNEV